jgi:hypothetical protein
MQYKVIQWATGAIGSPILKEAIQHPDVEVVGVKVYNPEKHGVDIGALVGLPDTGVKATSNRDEILALDADVVLHMPKAYGMLDEMLEDVCALLESGKDVITIAYYVAPEMHGPELVERLKAACKKGDSTLHATGIDPGFVCDRLPAALTVCSSDIRHITMLEAADITYHPDPDFMISLLGFGQRIEDLDLAKPNDGLDYMMKFFPEASWSLARMLGVELERVDVDPLLIVPATRDLEIGCGTIAKGTMAGVTWMFKAYRPGDEEPYITHQWSWYVEKGLPGMPQCDDAYLIRLDIEGSPSIHSEVVLTDPVDPIWKPTGMAAFNMIAEVVAAPPGIYYSEVSGAWRPRMKPRIN